MSDENERFREFSKSLDDGRNEPGRSVPDLTPNGYFAPPHEEAPKIEIEKEPHKAAKIIGGIISIIGGGVGTFFNAIALFIGLIFSILLLISGQIYFLIILILLIAGATGGLLTFIGGIMGIASKSRKGAILALIGGLLFLIGSIVGYLLYTGVPELAGMTFFMVMSLYSIPCSICGIIGAIILFVAYRTSYYVQ